MTDLTDDQPKADDWHAAAWMQTFTGKAFRPWTADVDDIEAEDIARSLSMTCRYNGHVRRFYSVAEHGVLMAEHFLALPYADDADRGRNRHLALWALLHDAAEAYIGDMVRPLKVTAVMEAYRDLDDKLTALIALRFGAEGTTIPPEVRAADNRILLDEREALLGAPAEPWHQDTQQVQPLGVIIRGTSPRYAESRYLDLLHELSPRGL